MTEESPAVQTGPDDASLEEELRRAATQIDPVPQEAIEFSVAAFTWRSVDAELAELAFDSLTDTENAHALVRGSAAPRSLTFRAPGLSIELEVTCGHGSCSLVGQLDPAGPARLEIRHGGGSITGEADDLGRFSVEPVPAGPLSLRCTAAAAGPAAVVTDWISI